MSSTSSFLPTLDRWLENYPPLLELYGIAQKFGYALGFVGGVVRDLLLGIEVRKDLDLLYSGNLEELRDLLRKRYRIHLRKAYQNLTIWAPQGRLDISNPRKDFYLTPGGIPCVEPASLEEDLSRRDFTWNALYLELFPERGKLLDLFGGLEDLRKGVIRPIHPHTLFEDPIRILRGIRYQGRFSFQREGKEWEDALRSARSPSFFQTVAPGRIWHEMKRLAEERRSLIAYELLAESGVDEGVLAFSLSRKDLALLEALRSDGPPHPPWIFFGDLILLIFQHADFKETILGWSPPLSEREKLLRLLEEVEMPNPLSPTARAIQKNLQENLTSHLR